MTLRPGQTIRQYAKEHDIPIVGKLKRAPLGMLRGRYRWVRFYQDEGTSEFYVDRHRGICCVYEDKDGNEYVY